MEAIKVSTDNETPDVEAGLTERSEFDVAEPEPNTTENETDPSFAIKKKQDKIL